MQLQAERDHFINGGIRTGGGGSSSSSLSSSPTSSVLSSPTLSSSPSLSPSSKVELDPQHLHRLKSAFSHRRHASPPTPPPQPAFVASGVCPPPSASSPYLVSTSTVADGPSTSATTHVNATPVAYRRPSPMHSRGASPVIPDLNLYPSATVCQPAVATVPPAHAGQLALLPSELLFHILCLLPTSDLCRLALTSKFYYALARDRTVWRIKCREHMLFSTRHLYAQPSVDWFAYYRYLHRNSRALDRNWSQATPQSVTVLEGHTSLVTSVELSLWTLVTASIDSTVRVWNLRTMECIQVLRCKHSITCVSQCDSIGAVCGRTSFGALIIWDIKTGQMVLQDNDACPNIASYMFMDERYIGYGTNDGSVTIFDWSSRSELEIAGSYHEHTGDIIYVSILNMEIVMSASTNGETLLYSLAKRRIIGRFLLPGAAQAVQCTPTICGNKVMFSTQDTIYEYELDLQDIVASFNQEKQLEEKMMLEAKHGLKISNTSKSFQSSSLSSPSSYSSSLSSPSMPSPPTNTRLGPHFQTSSVVGSSPRQWKPSNSLLSQIRQKIGTAKLMALSLGETESSSHSPSSDLSSPSSHSSSSPLPTTAPLSSTYRTASSLSSPMTAAGASSTPKSVPATTEPMMPTIPTRFPRSTSLYCLPPGSRMLDHGTTSARLSFGVFMRQGCESLRDMAVYSGKTRRLQTWSGAAVDRMLRDAVRSHYYTTMECNEHCVAISSGDKIYVVSFLPTDV